MSSKALKQSQKQEQKVHEDSWMNDEKKVVLVQSCIRRWLVRKDFKKLVFISLYHPSTAPLKKRNDVWRELLQTEKNYVKGLELLIKHFKRPLDDALKAGKPILKQEEIKTIFLNVEEILEVNRIFLDKLRESSNAWPTWNNFGKVVAEMIPSFKIYEQFIVDFDQSIKAQEEASQNKDWQNILTKAENSAELSYLPLQSYMILPIQRLPRYEMLLSQLLKLTVAEHIDYQWEKLATEAIKILITGANEKKKSPEMVKFIGTELKRTSVAASSLLKSPSFRFSKIRPFSFLGLLKEKRK